MIRLIALVSGKVARFDWSTASEAIILPSFAKLERHTQQ